MPLILASSSPRRVELLRAAGFEFTVRKPDVPEVHVPGESPEAYSSRLAHSKADAVWRQLAEPEEAFVIGADTIVVVGEQLLEKPSGEADAARMLRLLSGKSHRVLTSVCLIGKDSGGKVFHDARTESTVVHFSALTVEDIAEYIAHGEPLDKAGAYAIQGIASRWISGIQGCYFNVVGLPIPLLARMLREHDYR